VSAYTEAITLSSEMFTPDDLRALTPNDALALIESFWQPTRLRLGEAQGSVLFVVREGDPLADRVGVGVARQAPRKATFEAAVYLFDHVGWLDGTAFWRF
jgi:hypothetical protein